MQHVNEGDEDTDLLCCSMNLVDPLGVDRGTGFEILQDVAGGGV